MEHLSLRLPLAGRPVVLAGAGPAAEAMLGPLAGVPLTRLTDARAFDPAAYRGAAMAVVASGDDVFAQAAARAAKGASLMVYAPGRPALSDVEVAEGPPAATAARAAEPAMSEPGSEPGFRERLTDFLSRKPHAAAPEGSGRVAALLHRVQEKLSGVGAGMGERREALQEILRGPAAKAAAEGDMETAERLVREALERRKAEGAS